VFDFLLNYLLQDFIKQYANFDSSITIKNFSTSSANTLYNYKPSTSNTDKEENFNKFIDSLHNIEIYPDPGKIKIKQIISKKHIQVKKLQNQIEKCTIDMAIVDDELNYCEDDSLDRKSVV
jgi:hypothetical protein